jgi:hypothetical protein
MTAHTQEDEVMDNQPQKTPLTDHLRSVPANYRGQWEIQWAEDGAATGHAMSPLGRHAHEAADLIESLERERDALRALVMRVAEGKCTCTMSQRLNGDGCEVCNPQMAIEIARENAKGADHER